MAVILNKKMVLAPKYSALSSKPVIGWRSYVNRSNVTAEYEDQYFPASNLGNPATNSEWRSTYDGEQWIEVEIGGGNLVDYIGIAKHNLGSTGTEINIQALIVGEGVNEWVTIFDGQLLGSDKPSMLRFQELYPSKIRVVLKPNSGIPRVAVLYIGKATVMIRGMLQDVIPIKYADITEVATGRAENGDFIGRIITDQTKEVSYSFDGVPYDWFDEEMGPFSEASMTRPFFFAWLPTLFPNEIGYGWLNSDLNPSSHHYVGGIHVNFTMDITAIA